MKERLMRRMGNRTVAAGRPPRLARQDGFTLMELLVSMTVVSLLAVSILFGWRVAASAWGRVNELVDEQRRVASAQQILAMQMAEMTPVSPWLREGNAALFFQGEPRTARFLSRYSLLNRARSGLSRIEYHIAETPQGAQMLLLNEIPVPNTADPGALLVDAALVPGSGLGRFTPFERTPQTRVLLEEIAEAHFEYYRPAGPLGPGEWARQWPSMSRELPRAMAIRFSAEPVPNRLQPAAIVATIEDYQRVRP